MDVWYRRGHKTGTGLWTVDGVTDERHPDGASVPAADASYEDGPVLWRLVESEIGLARMEFAPEAAPGAPPMWFVNVDEPAASPAASNLVAYANDRFPAGTIITRFTFATAGVPNDEQAAAVRWYRNGRVHQIFVAPDFRRSHVGTALLYAASAFHQASGWEGRLHGDGRRTDLGEKFVLGLRHPHRISKRTAEMPPMDVPSDR